MTDSTSRSSQRDAVREFDDVTSMARSGLWLMGSSTVIWQGLSWVLTLLTARLLAPSDYGLMSLAETLMPYLALIASLDLVNWIIQEKHFGEAEQKATFTLSILLGLIVSLCGLVAAPIIADFYNSPDLKIPLLTIALTFVIKNLGTVADGCLRRGLQYKHLARMNLFVGVSRGVVQLTLAFLGFGYWSLFIGFLYRDIANTAYLLTIGKSPRTLNWNPAVWKKALLFGIPSTISIVLWVIFSTSHNAIVGKMFGTTVLGFYAMAFYLVDLPLSKLNSVLRPVLIPYYSRLKAVPELLEEQFLNSVAATSAVTLPAIAGLGFIAPELVSLFLGDKWIPLVTPLQVMAAVGVLRAFGNNVAPLYLALGKPKNELICNLFGACVVPPLFYFFGKLFGLNGIYAAWLLFFPFLLSLSLYLLEKTTKIPPSHYLKSLLPATAALCGMTFALCCFAYFLSDHLSAWMLLIGKIVIGAATYLSILYGFYGKKTFALISSLGIQKNNSSASSSASSTETSSQF